MMAGSPGFLASACLVSFFTSWYMEGATVVGRLDHRYVSTLSSMAWLRVLDEMTKEKTEMEKLPKQSSKIFKKKKKKTLITVGL